MVTNTPKEQVPVEESILYTVKKLLGISPDYAVYDPDLIVLINSTIMTLTQIGVGPQQGFAITGSDETWDEFLGDVINQAAAQTYIFTTVRLVFDPPPTSYGIESYRKMADECLWRLRVQSDILGDTQ